jgi:hypothetical protein
MGHTIKNWMTFYNYFQDGKELFWVDGIVMMPDCIALIKYEKNPYAFYFRNLAKNRDIMKEHEDVPVIAFLASDKFDEDMRKEAMRHDVALLELTDNNRHWISYPKESNMEEPES